MQFLNGSFGSGQTGKGGAVALAGDTAFELSALSSDLSAFPELGNIPNVSLNDFTNGRIYFNYGKAGLQGLGNGYQPSPNTSSDANYDTPYSYIELNVTGDQNNNMDLSAIDFFTMPIEATTWKNGKKVGELYCNGNQVEVSGVIRALEALSDNKAVVNAHGFVRVIGPGLAPGYHDWTSYLTYLAGLNYNTTLKGLFSGLPGGTGVTQQQNYALTASFDAATSQVTLSGTGTVTGGITITINYADLNAQTGVYGANPAYVANGTSYPGIQNDVFGWIVGDLLAGMNMGFVGSTTPNTNLPGNPALGTCTSSEWFAAAQQNPGLMFGGAQSNKDYYNGWAANLLPLTKAYGFPFSDRLNGELLYFPPAGCPNSVDYLKITFFENGMDIC
jgi:hypothetical protein